MTCFDSKVLASKAVSAVMPLVLLGCSTIPLGPRTAQAQSDLPQTAAGAETASQPEMDSQLMYELMIAELAGRRGQIDVAMSAYLSASQRTDDPRVSERATRLAMFGRQWAEAEKVARRWIKLDPDNAEAPQMLGQSLLRQNKSSQAAELYIGLIDVADDRALVMHDIQYELQRNENSATSVSVMQQLVAAYGSESEAHLGLARAYVTNSDTQNALDAVEAALAISPEDTDSLLLRAHILRGTGKPEEAFSSLASALDGNPDNTELRKGYAQLLVENGRYDQVGDELDRIREDSADDADTLLTISLLAIESRHIDQARSYLTDLLETGVYPDQANFYLARIFDDQKEFETAIEHYDAVEQGDLAFSAHIRAAELTAQAGDLDSGRSRLQALALKVPNPAMQPRLVTAESRMLQNANQNAEAVFVLSDGLERFPDDKDLLYSRALAADAAGNEALMINDLDQLIKLDPENAHALNALGYHYVDANIELVRAEELLIKANSLLPDDPAIMDSVGWLRFRQGRYAEAIKLLRSAYAVFPDPEIAAHLGEALWLSGAQSEARDLISTALQVNPEDERLLSVMKDVFK